MARYPHIWHHILWCCVFTTCHVALTLQAKSVLAPNAVDTHRKHSSRHHHRELASSPKHNSEHHPARGAVGLGDTATMGGTDHEQFEKNTKSPYLHEDSFHIPLVAQMKLSINRSPSSPRHYVREDRTRIFEVVGGTHPSHDLDRASEIFDSVDLDDKAMNDQHSNPGHRLRHKEKRKRQNGKKHKSSQKWLKRQRPNSKDNEKIEIDEKTRVFQRDSTSQTPAVNDHPAKSSLRPKDGTHEFSEHSEDSGVFMSSQGDQTLTVEIDHSVLENPNIDLPGVGLFPELFSTSSESFPHGPPHGGVTSNPYGHVSGPTGGRDAPQFGSSASTPPQATGLFGTVKTLVGAVKDLAAQHSEDRERIHALESKTASQEEELEKSSNRASKLHQDIKTIQSSIGTLQSRFEELRGRLGSVQIFHQRFRRNMGAFKKKVNRELHSAVSGVETSSSNLESVQTEMSLEIGKTRREMSSVLDAVDLLRDEAISRDEKAAHRIGRLEDAMNDAHTFFKDAKQGFIALQTRVNVLSENQTRLKSDLISLEDVVVDIATEPELTQPPSNSRSDDTTSRGALGGRSDSLTGLLKGIYTEYTREQEEAKQDHFQLNDEAPSPYTQMRNSQSPPRLPQEGTQIDQGSDITPEKGDRRTKIGEEKRRKDEGDSTQDSAYDVIFKATQDITSRSQINEIDIEAEMRKSDASNTRSVGDSLSAFQTFPRLTKTRPNLRSGSQGNLQREGRARVDKRVPDQDSSFVSDGPFDESATSTDDDDDLFPWPVIEKDPDVGKEHIFGDYLHLIPLSALPPELQNPSVSASDFKAIMSGAFTLATPNSRETNPQAMFTTTMPPVPSSVTAPIHHQGTTPIALGHTTTTGLKAISLEKSEPPISSSYSSLTNGQKPKVVKENLFKTSSLSISQHARDTIEDHPEQNDTQIESTSTLEISASSSVYPSVTDTNENMTYKPSTVSSSPVLLETSFSSLQASVSQSTTTDSVNNTDNLTMTTPILSLTRKVEPPTSHNKENTTTSTPNFDYDEPLGGSSQVVQVNSSYSELTSYIKQLEHRVQVLENSTSDISTMKQAIIKDTIKSLWGNNSFALEEGLTESEIKEIVANETLRRRHNLTNSDSEGNFSELRMELAMLKQDIDRQIDQWTSEQVARDVKLQRVQSLAGHTSQILAQLANQVSTINMAEFVVQLKESLGNFTQSVVTIDQWRATTDQMTNATLENESRIATVAQDLHETAHSVSKLHDRVTESNIAAQRGYRSLQGHVIRMNNTVQDMKESIDQLTSTQQKPSTQSRPHQDGTNTSSLFLETKRAPPPPLSDVISGGDSDSSLTLTRAKLDSLSIQLLFNANRLTTLESRLLNQSLITCQRSSAQLQQEATVRRLEDTQDVLRAELARMHEKVKRVDLSVFRAHSRMSSHGKSLSNIESRLFELDIVRPEVVHLRREVDNLLQNVPQDCQGYYDRGFMESGVYVIYPEDVARSVRAYCLMETTKGHNHDISSGFPEEAEEETNTSKESELDVRNDVRNDVQAEESESDVDNTGGWTVIQQRRGGKVNFTRDWTDYMLGFGRAGDEYWLGNDVIHLLTRQDQYELRIVMEDVFAATWEARYTKFKVGNSADGYRLEASGYHGNATDGLRHSDNMAFSTADRDNDASSSHCARFNGGGWWYGHCSVSNLNGPYDIGMVWFNRAWQDWVQMKSTRMMIRPRRDGRVGGVGGGGVRTRR